MIMSQQEITEETEIKPRGYVNPVAAGSWHRRGTKTASPAHKFHSQFSLFPPVQFMWSGLPLASLALLTGCAVGPDYKRPEATTIPPAYTGATNVVTTDSGATNGWKIAQPQAQIPKGNWWEIFGDAELNDLESQASAANQQLKVVCRGPRPNGCHPRRAFPECLTLRFVHARARLGESSVHDHRPGPRNQRHIQRLLCALEPWL